MSIILFDNYYIYQSYVWLYHINIYVDVTGYSWQLRQCKLLTVKTCGQINHGQLLFFMFATFHLNECWNTIMNDVNRQTLFFFSTFYVFCWRSWETATRVKPSKSGKYRQYIDVRNNIFTSNALEHSIKFIVNPHFLSSSQANQFLSLIKYIWRNL